MHIRRAVIPLTTAAAVALLVAAVASRPGPAYGDAPVAACETAYASPMNSTQKLKQYDDCRFDRLEQKLDALSTPQPTVTKTVTASASPTATASPTPTTTPTPSSSPAVAFPDATNTGVPAAVTLHPCTLNGAGTYDLCQFSTDLTIRSAGVVITRSKIDGGVGGVNDDLLGVVIRDSTIDCHCPSVDATHTPSAIMGSNFTLTRVNISNAGHGAAVSSNVTITDSWIHGLGGNTDAHKDGIYVGDGGNVTLRHNNIECADGPAAGCTAAIGLLSDFGVIHDWTIDNNLLNTNGSFCFYGGGGPQKAYQPNHISFTNNHFGRKNYPNCGFYGPVTYFDSAAAGNVWSGNVWDDTGVPVAAEY